MSNTERNNMIADDFIDGKSVDDLAGTYGLGSRMIHRMLCEKGLKATDRIAHPCPLDWKKVKSQLHKKIGSRLHNFFFIEKGLTRVQAAEAIGISAKALTGVELGRNNLQLTELQNIASFMGSRVGDLVDE